MISYDEFKEYYMFLDDYLFNVFEEIKFLNCFNIGANTQYEGIIDLTADTITIAYAILNDNMEFTDYSGSIKIPSDVIFDDNKLKEWIQTKEAYGTFNSRTL